MVHLKMENRPCLGVGTSGKGEDIRKVKEAECNGNIMFSRMKMEK
jgi:hypothetical protein